MAKVAKVKGTTVQHDPENPDVLTVLTHWIVDGELKSLPFQVAQGSSNKG